MSQCARALAEHRGHVLGDEQKATSARPNSETGPKRLRPISDRGIAKPSRGSGNHQTRNVVHCKSTLPIFLSFLDTPVLPETLLLSAMTLADAVAALNFVGELAAVVPVVGPQLAALIKAANELCAVAEVRKLSV